MEIKHRCSQSSKLWQFDDEVLSVGPSEGAWWCHSGCLGFTLPLKCLVAKQTLNTVFAVKAKHHKKAWDTCILLQQHSGNNTDILMSKYKVKSIYI